MKLVETVFNEYMKRVYKDQIISHIQHKELKNAFYAAYYSAITELSTISDKFSEDQAVQVLQSMFTECTDYAQEVIDKLYKSN